MANAKFVIYADKANKYRWRLVSSNGQETASSGQHFASHADAKRAAEHVKERAATATVIEGKPTAEEVEPGIGAAGVEPVSEALTLTVHFKDAGDGWIMAQVAEVPGAISQGRTRAEARDNVIDALRTVLTPEEQLNGRAAGADDEPLTLTIA